MNENVENVSELHNLYSINYSYLRKSLSLSLSIYYNIYSFESLIKKLYIREEKVIRKFE